MDDSLNKEDAQPFPVGATGSLTIVSYLPQTVGVTIGRILNLQPIIILWLGRITNLLAYIALIFLSIKIIPSEKFKAIVMIISLLPMSLNLAATLSPDTIIIATTVFAISYVLYLKFKKDKITLIDIIILGISCMIPTICKAVYFPMCLMLWILPKEKFEGRKNISYLLFFAIIIVPYIIFKKLSKFGTYAISIRSNMMEQCLFAISDLTRDFEIAINTMYSEFSKYLFEVIGGWNTIDFVSIVFLLILLMAIFTKSKENEKYSFNKKDKIICAIIILIEFLEIMAALYLSWTQGKQKIVEGVQGRYFLPLLPILCVVLSKNKLKYSIKNKSIKYILCLSVCYLIIFTFSIRFYLV